MAEMAEMAEAFGPRMEAETTARGADDAEAFERFREEAERIMWSDSR